MSLGPFRTSSKLVTHVPLTIMNKGGKSSYLTNRDQEVSSMQVRSFLVYQRAEIPLPRLKAKIGTFNKNAKSVKNN